jgi:NAD(P)-dependent dehydrogenase (short-subunit alcohol dehydrogenase family)
MRLQPGDVAVVTGAASGIGLALADALRERDVALVLADRDTATLAEAAVGLSERGGRVIAVETDVSRFDDVEQLAARAFDHFGRVDLVCNVAGVSHEFAPLWEFDATDWQWVMDVNLQSVVNGVRAFVPKLIERKRGHIVNMASLAGLTTIPFNGPYNVSKHAIVALTQTLRIELHHRAPGVSATVVCPGRVRTRLHESSRQRPARFEQPAGLGASRRKQIEPVESSFPSDVIEASEVARTTIDGVEADRLFVLPGDHTAAFVEAAVAGLLDELRSR